MFNVSGQASGLRIAQGEQLDVAHLHKVCAYFLSHYDTVASDCGGVGGRDGFIQSRP